MDRRSVVVRGIVQGVGFRPFVHRLATECRLAGFVRNRSEGVAIEIEGDEAAIERFLEALPRSAPPLARIDSISSSRLVYKGEQGFRIIDSEASGAPVQATGPQLPADTATCESCLAELRDPADRRFGYPFINCTNCGPRLTIIVRAPYDRPRTTMAQFSMCPACRAEYDRPSDRRFHAQPIACPACGPRLELRRPSGEPVDADDPTAAFAEAILAGKIGAVKGLGGYHLVCDAGNGEAVLRLRRRKQREEKPLALMLADVAAARRICQISPEQQALLESPARPIVLLTWRQGDGIQAIADAVAPGNPNLGVMLPYTPLHHLLMDRIGGIPLVMTSGNRSDEPIAYEDDDALDRLGEIADLFLCHDRPIHVRCDDSVTRIVAGEELPIRRSRGYTPQPIKLPIELPRPLLAVGGQLKGVFALAAGEQAFLSHHLGDLDHAEACRQFERDVSLYEELFEIAPAAIVHDLHPDYASTSYAQRRAAEFDLPLFAVQHHEAHVAACMAENGLDEPVIGVALDGTGFGIDAATGQPAVWGGEFFVGDYRAFRRAAHLRYVALPGGDQAARQPWRMALSHLIDAGCSTDSIDGRVAAGSVRTIRSMIARGVNSPPTSSMGRLFDAVASIIGLRDVNRYEGQAAIDLENAASQSSADGAYPFELTGLPEAMPMAIDTRPMIRAIAADVARGLAAGRIARRFQTTLVEILAATCRRLGERMGIESVALSGGVFMNALLTTETAQRLSAEGLRVYRHRRVPPGDGGLCLGQVAIAAARLRGAGDEGRAAGSTFNCVDRKRTNPCVSAYPVG